MASAQSILERYAAGVPYESLADAFLEFERYTERDPLLLVAEAAASTTGQGFAGGVHATVERFREAFLEPERIESLADLAAIDPEDDDLVEAFGAQRKRRVLRAVADALADRPESDDFESLRAWACEADVYRYETDPIGEISGVGPSTFQYLRILAGVDTARPSPPVVEFVESVADELDAAPIDADGPLRTVASCEWLATETTFRRLEIDRLAWWAATDEDERDAVVALSGVDPVVPEGSVTAEEESPE